ncbi:hypothetical protein BZA05DRAFT_442282 [Tricharina praecox]|uniref:uncharacterized protein n=1 Tax=Tricharina praecox TaxID=43433 RepID=UPI00221EF708|nr:uncharacterized protein BZA05DRAFT_442282 [Tricharina praecox]KAI5856600.1 hypothetical protein BZA05DRAFT_442282 [Tricharina praecox]
MYNEYWYPEHATNICKDALPSRHKKAVPSTIRLYVCSHHLKLGEKQGKKEDSGRSDKA